MRIPRTLVYLVLPFALLTLSSAACFAAAAKPAKAAAANASSLRAIEYPSLEDKLVVKTTNGTTRSGELTRYTNVTLTLQLGPENGSIELTVPRDTIRKILIEIPPADPLFLNEDSPHEGDSGAKKN
jgi:flagellar basal body-associated protein FliL